MPHSEKDASTHLLTFLYFSAKITIKKRVSGNKRQAFYNALHMLTRITLKKYSNKGFFTGSQRHHLKVKFLAVATLGLCSSTTIGPICAKIRFWDFETFYF